MKNATLTRSEAARLRPMVERIVAHYDAASESDRIAGDVWYQRAMDAATILRPDDPQRAAGVIAALSPRCQWRTNLAWAAKVLSAADAGEPCPSVHTTAMRSQAWRIAHGEPWGDVLNGPKVRAFAANITGDDDTVTVDVWAARAAERVRDDRAPSGRRYRLIARAYREAAARRNVTPRAMQATVWCHVRGAAD